LVIWDTWAGEGAAVTPRKSRAQKAMVRSLFIRLSFSMNAARR
jgi:hypothetical protein